MFDRKIIDELKESNGYSIALLTTFNFEINYFERCILNTLYNNDIRKVEIFVDSNELDKAIHESKDNNLNKKYVANPIAISSAFHPKIILLLGEKKAKLIVSSANVKTSGYTLNNEIYNVFIYDEKNQNNLNLINSAIQFFYELNDISYYIDEDIFNSIKEFAYTKKVNGHNEIRFIQNLNIPIIEQLTSIIKEKIESIDIAVPYFDNKLLAYKELREKFECANINLYIQNEKSTFPMIYNQEKNILEETQIKPYYVLKSNEKKNFYHGKVFRFNTAYKSYILYGSSNCTLSAIAKTYKAGGNVECDILEIGSIDDYNYFFDNFKLDYTNKLVCNVIEYGLRTTENYTFKYGIGKSNINLYFNYREKKDDLKITLGELNLVYEYNENELVVSIAENIMQELNNIFDLTFQFDDIKETIKCWFIDTETINNFRKINKEMTIKDIEMEENINKYREYMELIIKTLALTTDEYLEQISLSKAIQPNKSNDVQDDLDEDAIDDNFVIDKDIPDEYIRKNKDFTYACMKSKMFATRYFSSLKLRENKESIKLIEIQDEDKKERKPRAPTPVEKKFARFVKTRLKGMLNKEYIELVDYEHYKNAIGIIFDIINEFKYKENIDGIFDDIYVLEISKELMSKLLEKNNSDETDSESTIILSLMTILKNHFINLNSSEKSYKTETDNKALLKKLDDKYKIREDFKEYVDYAVDNINLQKNIMSYDYAERYIEGIFLYKTEKQIEDIIKKQYGEDARIIKKEAELLINGDTYDIKKYMNFNTNIVNEILNNYEHYDKPLNRLIIQIKNLKSDYGPSADPIDNLIYDINLTQKNYIKLIKRKSGIEDKPEYNKL